MRTLRPRKKFREECSNLLPRKLIFSNVKDLLATGFFQGVAVKYVIKKYNVELDGVIEGIGYRCGCRSCKYGQVLSANLFEKHSGFTSSFANNHILLANGVSLNEVVKYLAEVPLAELHREMEAFTGCKIDPKLYEAWRNNMSGHKDLQMKQSGATEYTHQEEEVPFHSWSSDKEVASYSFKTSQERYEDWVQIYQVEQRGGGGEDTDTSQEVPFDTIGQGFYEDWINGRFSTCEVKPIDNMNKNTPSTFAQYSHVVPLDDKEMEAITGCGDHGNGSSPTSESSDYGVKQNHEAKQTRDIDNTRRGVPLTFAHTNEGVPKKRLFNEMEVPAIFKINSKLCEYRRNGFGASDNMNQEVPSTFVHTNNQEVKQTEMGVMTSEKAQPTFTQRLPLNLSFSHKSTCTNQDPEETSPRKKLRFKSCSFLPSNVAEVDKLKAGALKTQDIFSPKTPEFKQKQAISTERLNVRRVLATGLLEGLPVKYKKDKVELNGFIKDQLYQCGCSSCKYNEVISAVEFERHAGANSKNQNNHIFLESGMSIYALVKSLKRVPHDLILNEIKEKILPSPGKRGCLSY